MSQADHDEETMRKDFEYQMYKFAEQEDERERTFNIDDGTCKNCYGTGIGGDGITACDYCAGDGTE